MKRLLSLSLLVLAVAAGVWGYFYVNSGGSAPQYRISPVERGRLISAVSATGTVNAVTTVQVGSQVTGQIKQLLVDFNSAVRKGEIIARIDPATFEAKVHQASAELEGAEAAVLNQQAQIERARADVENMRAAHAESRAQTARAQVALADARRDLDRKTELFRRDLIAKSERDTAQATYDSADAMVDAARAKERAGLAAIGSAQAQLRVAEAQAQTARSGVKQRQAALRQSEADLGHTIIRAPVDGIVVSRQVDVGQTVAASLQAPVLFTIAEDLTKMQVDTSVDEADIGRVAVDGPATFTVDAFPGETFTGRVVQIRKAAQVVQNVVTYIVVVAVANPRGRLLPGMTANIKLVVADKGNVLKIPNAALRFRPPGTDEASSGARDGAAALPPVAEVQERLVKGLGLSPEQQARLKPILEESRQQMVELRRAGLQDGAQRERSQKIRNATRARIREILTPEQQASYDGREQRGVTARVFTLGPDGKPRAVPVTIGITDGSVTEMVQGELSEGERVILGLAGGQSRGGGGGGPRLRL